ncbi:MAG: hypothetical protein H6810_09965 [Phycisphaeraceae bacterium]|nr:MAG: hypothetical protein H6810_09965 [Phycisphaeraceae bacterium]
MTIHAIEIRIGPETETGQGWSYEITVSWPSGAESAHEVTLSWSDHDLISGGLHPPSQTVDAALRLAASIGEAVFGAGGWPARFDVATLRRRIDRFDERVRERL